MVYSIMTSQVDARSLLDLTAAKVSQAWQTTALVMTLMIVLASVGTAGPLAAQTPAPHDRSPISRLASTDGPVAGGDEVRRTDLFEVTGVRHRADQLLARRGDTEFAMARWRSLSEPITLTH